MKPEVTLTCQVCGARVPAGLDFCPVCALRGVLGDTRDTTEIDVELTDASPASRFDHYQLLTRADGTLFELGHGAMGVTYKAIDINLRCAVALKVISARFIGDESARRRFVREARAAASVRHPNVAAVFHLGQIREGYFYAMEFVEGETLESLIKRAGRLELKLALEIASQAAAGLAAVHKGKLVHRDIKPSNLMVSLDEGGGVTVKVIDLGLAKSLDEQGSQSAISMPGGFAGTPEFASPEQFAGVGVDIRSDLYSLGVVLWEMLTGRPPFRGTPAELIYLHQHGVLPLKQLKGVPPQVTAILKTLLDKDPKRRFQTPGKLLNTLSVVTNELEKPADRKRNLRSPLVQVGSSRRTMLGRTKPQERSVAVLPFESLSAGKKDTYFADGVQDEILSNLAKVSQLKVISRTSVMAFRPRDSRNLRSIGASLGVANVVEGTVRRDRKHVRLTIRLVDARTDKTLWSETYDRDLTDIFAIQSDVAQNVAAKLAAQLSPKEWKEIREKPTKDVGAYDLYLLAKQLVSTVVLWSSQKENYPKAINLLEQATQKDPSFALAYCLSAKAHDHLYVGDIDHTPERRALGGAAVNEALRLRPDLPEARLALASHLFYCHRDFKGASVQVTMAAQALPNNPDLLQLTAAIDRVRGQWEMSTAGLERAASLDPLNPDVLDDLSVNYECLRRYRDEERVLDRLAELAPHEPRFRLMKARISFYEKANLNAPRAAYEALPPPLKADPQVRTYGGRYATCARDFAAAKETLNIGRGEEVFFCGTFVPRQIVLLWLELIQGNRPTMEEFGAARAQLCRKVEADSANPFVWSALAWTDVALGRKEEAIKEARRAMEMRPVSEDAKDGPMLAISFAVVCAWANQLDLAFQQLYIAIRMPNEWLSYGDLKMNPIWDPLRNDSRFEKLLVQLAPNQSSQKTLSSASRLKTNKRSVRLGPKKISVARLPVTGSDLFGREEDIVFLDRAWANQDINVVTIVAWGGVGKSTLINHWLRRMATDRYRAAELVFGWSFYRQGTSGETSSADEFLDAALTWFGDPDPRLGTAWEKGERLANLVANRRTLLVLDGLEPLQNPPGPQEGRLQEPALQALLRELAAFNKGLCIITSRTPVADIADHERSSTPRRDLEQLSSEAGAKVLRALGVKGDEAELRSASEEFGGHCLALTLLGSYLSDACRGDIRYRNEVTSRLAHDVRQGVHARKVMESYQTWFGEGPELAVLRMLGLFDRPADETAIAALLESPAIPALTESLIDLSQIERRTIIARLRRARLLAAEDPNNPGQLDAHPLVREYFGEQLRTRRIGAWKESNRRLYKYYQSLAPELPETFREMEPLFLAVIHGCNAGLYREALHEVYVPCIQRENSSFAANVLGAGETLLSVLGQFFENGRWESPVVRGAEEHSLSDEDELFILLQAGQYLTATGGSGTPGVRVCYERAESLCHALNRPHFLYVSLMGQWRHLCATGRGTARLQLAQRIYSLARERNEVAQLIGAFSALAITNYSLGDFEASYQYAVRGVERWRSGGLQSTIEEVDVPCIACLCYLALGQWHNDNVTAFQATIEEAISLARELNDMHGLAFALSIAASIACDQHNLIKAELYASELIELSTRYHFASWKAAGAIERGRVLSAAGKIAEGILTIEQGIRDLRATGELISDGFFLALRAEALYLADRSYEALETIKEAEFLAERFESRAFDALFPRLRGVFLAAIGAEETEIESSFRQAIRVAKEQKSVILTKRAEATYAEYLRQKVSGSGARRLWDPSLGL